MQVGSAIKCINDHNWVNKVGYIQHGYNITFPIIGPYYIIRAFCPVTTGLLLEEIINPQITFESSVHEPSFRKDRFVEVQPPMAINISEIQHQTEKI